MFMYTSPSASQEGELFLALLFRLVLNNPVLCKNMLPYLVGRIIYIYFGISILNYINKSNS